MPLFHRWLRSALVLCGVVLSASTVQAQSTTLEWDPSPNAAGYVVRWGSTVGSYPHNADVGNATSFAFTNLVTGSPYVAVVEAYDATGVRSAPSQPLQFIAIDPASPSPNSPTGPVTDVDQDGRPDIIWQNVQSGHVATWTMLGERLKSSDLTSPGRVPDTGWRIAGSGDFNADTKPDLVWQHRTNGWLAVWLMDGLQLIESATMTPGRISDPAWEIATVGDMNGDGKSDLVWQDRSKGWIAVWLMNGTSLQQSVGLDPERVPDTAWRIVAAADLNADGKHDLLWQHAKDGSLAAWLMNGARLQQSVALNPDRVDDPNWKVGGVADANGDGQPDIFWQDTRGGNLGLWLMNGLSLSASIALQPERLTDTNWRIVAVR